ncbi:active regulator of SIRT1 [Lepidochelys kempii]|uniref:active regulator of SIRT1 n=1 Tax=Lepidochelys kempii TaxID=8472 RepID=UPI003C6F82B2
MTVPSACARAASGSGVAEDRKCGEAEVGGGVSSGWKCGRAAGGSGAAEDRKCGGAAGGSGAAEDRKCGRAEGGGGASVGGNRLHVGRMSASLLRKGLELLETEMTAAAGHQPGLSSPQQRPRTAPKRRKAARGPGRNKTTAKGKVTKSAIEEYRKHQAVDHLKKNLQYMTKGRFTVDKTITQQVLNQNRGRKSRDRPPKKPKKKSEGTVFTEEDFQKFEREYFGRAGAV